jgi:hypothetical protein
MTFTIQDDFKHFEATSWAVEEFKRHGLKRLFKPITSTAYKSLITQFYEHLTFNCNKLGIMSSSIKGMNIEVTSANIVAALKCNDDHPPGEGQFEVEPPMLIMVDIIGDMCDAPPDGNIN